MDALIKEEFADELQEEEQHDDAQEDEVKENMISDIKGRFESDMSSLELAKVCRQR